MGARDWKRPVVAVGVLAVAVLVLTVVWYFPYIEAMEEWADDDFDYPGEPTHWWRMARLWVFWVLVAPGLIALGPNWLIIPLSSLVWAVVLYATWLGVRATWHWWRAR